MEPISENIELPLPVAFESPAEAMDSEDVKLDLAHRDIARKIGKVVPVSGAYLLLISEKHYDSEQMSTGLKNKLQNVSERLLGERFGSEAEAMLALSYAEAIGIASELIRDEARLKEVQDNLSKIENESTTDTEEKTGENLNFEDTVNSIYDELGLEIKIDKNKKLQILNFRKMQASEVLLTKPFDFKELMKSSDKLEYLSEKIKSVRLGGNKRVEDIKKKVEEKLTTPNIQSRINMMASRSDRVMVPE